MIEEQEVTQLAATFGQPVRRQVDLDIGPSLFYTRFMRQGDRRGEVVFALERTNGRLLLHRKAHYGDQIYRLLSGGIDLGEPVLDALYREVAEECGLRITVQRFLALLDTRFHFGTITLPFASYVFHVRECGGQLNPNGQEIDELIEIWPEELPGIAERLRGIQGERSDWGRWRAIAHEVVVEWVRLER